MLQLCGIMFISVKGKGKVCHLFLRYVTYVPLYCILGLMFLQFASHLPPLGPKPCAQLLLHWLLSWSLVVKYLPLIVVLISCNEIHSIFQSSTSFLSVLATNISYHRYYYLSYLLSRIIVCRWSILRKQHSL